MSKDTIDMQATDVHYDVAGEGGKRSFNPRAKRNYIIVGSIVGVMALGALGAFLMPKKKNPESESQIGNMAESQRSTDATSPRYMNLVDQQNKSVLSSAEKNGESYLPRVIASPESADSMSVDAPVKNVAMATTPSVNGGDARGGKQASQAVAYTDILQDPVVQRQFQRQVKLIEDIRKESEPVGHQTVVILPSHYLADKEKAEKLASDQAAALSAAAQSPNQSGGNGNNKTPPEYLNRVMKSDYLVLDKPINADYDPLVLASVQTGPFRGAKLQGEAKRTTDQMSVHFTKMLFNNEIYQINGVGLDDQTASALIDGNYNSEFFGRVFVPFLFGFAQGAAEGKAQPGNQVVVGSNSTITQATPALTNTQVLAAGIKQGIQDTKALYMDTVRKPSVTTDAGRELMVVWLGV